MRRAVSLLVASAGVAAGLDTQWEAVANGIPELEAVEKSLQKVSTAKLGPKLQAAAQRAVKDVEQVAADLQNNRKLTKEQKKAKVKGAIREMEGLQSQWQLASVEASLKEVVSNPRLAPKQLASAKKVVADIDAALDEVEAGKLDAEGRKKKVAFAIQKLQGLQQELTHGAGTSKEAELERKIAEKKALLKKAEGELKITDLEKKLLEKKVQLQNLVAAKSAAEGEEKQRKEGEAEHEQVSKLIAAAKSLAAVRKAMPAEENATAQSVPSAGSTEQSTAAKTDAPKHSGPGNAAQKMASSTDMKAILAQLQVKVKTQTAGLAKFDSDFQQRMAELKRAILASKKANYKKGRMLGSSDMLESALNRQSRMHLKARAFRVAEINDLRNGIQSIEKGDVVALSSLLGKMQKESKSMQAQGQDFLH